MTGTEPDETTSCCPTYGAALPETADAVAAEGLAAGRRRSSAAPASSPESSSPASVAEARAQDSRVLPSPTIGMVRAGAVALMKAGFQPADEAADVALLMYRLMLREVPGSSSCPRTQAV